MNVQKIRSLSGGANQSGLRDYNERLLLSMLLRNGPMPGSDLARMAGLSAQTVSIIYRKLEHDGLLERGPLQRGRVGKPSVPMGLAPDGVFSYGLKVGRRSADLLLIDFAGKIRFQCRKTYAHPTPNDVIEFLQKGMQKINDEMTPAQQQRVCGIGIAAPFELWHQNESTDYSTKQMMAWQDFDFQNNVAAFCPLPIYMLNDATAACRAEHSFGRGKEFRDYVYFFVAAYVGGGIVLNHSVFEGHQSNAGALGALRSTGPNGESRQLVDVASLHVLEARLEQANINPKILWEQPQNWDSIRRYVEPWIGQTAQELSKAAISSCSVIDFEAVLIDGAFPDNIRRELVARTSRYLRNQDMRGLIIPQVEEGSIGGNASAIGAASTPIFSQYLLNTNVGIAGI